MKKKLLCLLLCAVMLVSVLAGCAGETDPTASADSSRKTVTLTMWVICEETVSLETEAQIEEAFNTITEADYTTHVDLVFCTEDEYEIKLEQKFNHIESNPGKSKPSQNPYITITNKTYRDDEGMTRLEYPDVWEYQMDIVLVTGREMLDGYISKGRVQDLTSSLNTTNKIIKKYVNNALLNNAAINGKWYGIPNNNIIGNYTFMLVNKEMALKYEYEPEQFTSFGFGTAAAELIEKIAQNEDTTQIAPMYGMADYPLVKYWSTYGSDSASVLATMYANSTVQIGNAISAVNIFSDANYQSFMREMFYCKENGYFVDAEQPQDTFGVAVLEGDYSFYETYGEDYYVVPLTYPRLEDENVFGSMFAVSSYTANLDRSMEIIRALTCETELRNILQYGIEGTHYEIRDDGTLKRLNSNYMMNINYTGNTFKAYPEEGMPANFWQDVAKHQNREALLSIAFGTASYLSQVDADAWEQMSAVSQSYFDRLDKCETLAELNSFMDVASKEIAASDYYVELNPILDGKEYDMTALNGALQNWWNSVYGG
ncbi:MAG: hypothetical protein IJ009_07380 [Clostridia bacterium]|nr:hypothetical protein [Clostridia bacterium]